ncbi:MAG TPA: hypothetical protein VIM75_18170 [Ohtaekwangia sp.]|uniref:hypothetical protein n=1 Tax=Ohtaekwangia sp. TaxID=2066019 RepID=UPI002F955F56
MAKITYSPELLTQLSTIKKLSLEIIKIDEDKSDEQLLAEIEIIHEVLNETKRLIEKRTD